MRLLNELPEIENKIVNGELSLSVLSQTQSFFKKKEREKEPVKKEEKLDLLASLENSSARECEQKLVELDPELAQRDREQPIGQKLVELRLTVDEGFMSEVKELKDLLAHAMPFGTTKDI